MSREGIQQALANAIGYLSEHPDQARYTDSVATARLVEDLRVRVEGKDGQGVETDMPPSVGGGATAPSAGWLLRAAEASCVATLIAMRAAMLGKDIDELEVTVDSESDDRGILGIDPTVPAGPLGARVHIRLRASGVSAADLDAMARWGVEHCPVCDAVHRSVPMTVEVDAGA